MSYCHHFLSVIVCPLLSSTEPFVVCMVHQTSFMVVVLLVMYVLIILLLWETIKYQIPKLSNLVKSKWLIKSAHHSCLNIRRHVLVELNRNREGDDLLDRSLTEWMCYVDVFRVVSNNQAVRIIKIVSKKATMLLFCKNTIPSVATYIFP